MTETTAQPSPTLLDIFERPIRVGQSVLYAGYGSSTLSRGTVVGLRERRGRSEILVKLNDTARNTVAVLHHPLRVYVLGGKEPKRKTR